MRYRKRRIATLTITVRMILRRMQVTTGKKKEKPSRSRVISPGRRPTNGMREKGKNAQADDGNHNAQHQWRAPNYV